MAMDLKGWTLAIDLDGTLVDTAPDLSAALNHVLGTLALDPVPLSDIRHMIGHGARAMIQEGLAYHQRPVDENLIETQLFPQFIEHYLAHICDHSAPFPGAVETIEHLRADGARLAICTNKTQKLATEVLKGLDLISLFDAVLGADAASARKPAPAHILESVTNAGGNHRKAIMIGDSQTDERAARAAELPFVFVTFGYGDLDELDANPAWCVDSWSELPDPINRITRP